MSSFVGERGFPSRVVAFPGQSPEGYGGDQPTLLSPNSKRLSRQGRNIYTSFIHVGSVDTDSHEPSLQWTPLRERFLNMDRINASDDMRGLLALLRDGEDAFFSPARLERAKTTLQVVTRLLTDETPNMSYLGELPEKYPEAATQFDAAQRSVIAQLDKAIGSGSKDPITDKWTRYECITRQYPQFASALHAYFTSHRDDYPADTANAYLSTEEGGIFHSFREMIPLDITLVDPRFVYQAVAGFTHAFKDATLADLEQMGHFLLDDPHGVYAMHREMLSRADYHIQRARLMGRLQRRSTLNRQSA